jgi:hypothetical protein
MPEVTVAAASESVDAAQMKVGSALKRWIDEHKAELSDVEFSRIDASLERLMMKLALSGASEEAAKGRGPAYRFLWVGERIEATDEYLDDIGRRWIQVDPNYAEGTQGAHPEHASIFRGAPYMHGMKPVRRAVTCAAIETDAVSIGGAVYLRAGGYSETPDGRNLPVFIAEGNPDARELAGGDAIARSKRILELVDNYVERPDSGHRTTLRVALMDEFTALLAARDEVATPEFLHICEEELVRTRLTSMPLKYEQAKARGMTIEQLHDWMRATARAFKEAVTAACRESITRRAAALAVLTAPGEHPEVLNEWQEIVTGTPATSPRGEDSFPPVTVVLLAPEKQTPNQRWYLRVEKDGAVTSHDLPGAGNPVDARAIARELGFEPTHWVGLPAYGLYEYKE